MARIKINDIPKDMKISRNDLKQIVGGTVVQTPIIVDTPVSSSIGDAASTSDMQEMNMSFNLQYLQLQQDMQAQNRQYTLVSNIMKVKHDTAKAAINNVR